MNRHGSSSAAASRRTTAGVAVTVALASWFAMALVLGYGGMQRAVSPTAERLPELLLGVLAGGVAAFAACWTLATVTKSLQRIGWLLVVLVLVDVGAALGALVLFNEIPFERFPILVVAAMGGGSQLLGAALGCWAVSRPYG